MQPGDWFHATLNVVIGALLGSAIFGVTQLIISGFWLSAVITIIVTAALFLLMELSDKLLDRVFSIGIRPARKPQSKRKNPLPRVLSLPAGFAVGILLAVLGIDTALLSMLP